MSASTALVVSAIAGVVLGMAFVKMPPPATTDFQGQQAPVQTTTSTGPVAPAPVIHTSAGRPSRSSSWPTATTTTTSTTTSTTTTGTRPTKTSKPKPPKPTKTTGGTSTTTTTDDGGLLGPILPGLG
ncbi:hypothetical protein ACFFS4_26225 [Kutzneria kofuensis]|uniref:Cytoskeletal protein RodZ n=1 Tax=Kutzneria kofuensis TaxID=103725 RepID=A0A7W9KPW9_9PSEU|nr:hypothetical protein [Kutzneria kofuensis]MBB5895789.1 cytoskeletal protein RodZ [Kutzneria kofuensis]